MQHPNRHRIAKGVPLLPAADCGWVSLLDDGLGSKNNTSNDD
jgi:hypothetical protein